MLSRDPTLLHISKQCNSNSRYPSPPSQPTNQPTTCTFQLEGDEGHWEGLWLYATIAEERGMRDDALAVALRLLVARSGHAGVRALLARCLLVSLFSPLLVPEGVGEWGEGGGDLLV